MKIKKEFYIDIGGNANFKGDITGASGSFSGDLVVGGTTLDVNNTLNTNTTKSQVGVSNITNPTSATTPIGEGDVVGAIDDDSLDGAVIQDNTMSGGKITAGTLEIGKLESNSTNYFGAGNVFQFEMGTNTAVAGFS